MGNGLKRVAKQCGGLTVKAGGKTTKYGAGGRPVAVVTPRTVAEIQAKIRELEHANHHILQGELSNIQINAPRALMQLEVEAELKTLHWVLGTAYVSKLSH